MAECVGLKVRDPGVTQRNAQTVEVASDRIPLSLTGDLAGNILVRDLLNASRRSREQSIAPSGAVPLVIDVTNALNAKVSLTSNLVMSLAVGALPGEDISVALTQDSNGRRHVDFSAFENGNNFTISKSAGATTNITIHYESAAKQYVRLDSSTDGNTTKRIITNPQSCGSGGIGGGVPSIHQNVVDTACWTWEEVSKYEIALYTDLQISGSTTTAQDLIEANTFRGAVPNVKVLAMIRQDLFWFYNESIGIQDATKLWGTITPLPTVDMLQPVKDGPPWDDPGVGQAQIEAAGYVIDPDIVGLTNNGALLTNPNQLSLDATNGIWSVRNTFARWNNEAWLDLLTDNIVAQRKSMPWIDGFYINYQKIGTAATAYTSNTRLWKWLDGSENPGWDLATNTGGPSGAWANGQDAYDSPGAEDTVLDVTEGTNKIVDMLRYKDPSAFLLASPLNFTQPSWRNLVFRDEWRAAAIAKYATIINDAQADQTWADDITAMAAKAHGIEVYADNIPNEIPGTFAPDFPAPWLANIRALKGKNFLWSIKPQDISNQDDW